MERVMGELKKKLAECVQALAKAREDKAIAPERRKEFREAKLDMPGSQDFLANQLTSAKGVSERGIEARRGDSKVPGAIAHGFGRVTEPSKHMESAKKLFRAIKNMQAKVPKMNLPKSENLDKGGKIRSNIPASDLAQAKAGMAHGLSRLHAETFGQDEKTRKPIISGSYLRSGARGMRFHADKSAHDINRNAVGVHKPALEDSRRPGDSVAGHDIRRDAQSIKAFMAGPIVGRIKAILESDAFNRPNYNRGKKASAEIKGAHQKVLSDLKAMPKPNLPKSEDMSKAITPKEVSEPIISNPTKVSERMIINSPTYFNQNGDSTVRLKKILKKCKGV